MSLSKFLLGPTSVILLTACAPSAKQSVEQNHDVASSHAAHQTAKSLEDTMHGATVKPGAAITLKTVLPKVMTSGTYQTVQLELADQYQDGVMTVSIEPSEGLTLFAGSNSKTFDMSNPGPHVWDVDVKAENDGVYFLNVFSQAQGQPRSFSVRLNVGVSGAAAQKMFNDAMPAEGKLEDSADGTKIRVLEATETIK